jgi:SHAQKYF class myb-like DNA-binding protein
MQEVASSGKKSQEDNIDKEDPKEESTYKKEIIKPQDDESLSEEDLHRALVAAIFEYGVTHACPASISDNMQSHPPELTKARIKSRLQKFRKRRKKEKEEFLDDYDKFLDEAKQGNHGPNSRKLIPKVVAVIAHSVMQKGRSAAPLNTLEKTSAPENTFTRTTSKYAYPATKMPFPVLTEKEKSSAIGKSLDLTLELVQHMHKHLIEQRQAGSKDVKRPPSPMMACHLKRRASTETSQKEASIAAQEGLGEYSQSLPKQEEQPHGSNYKRTPYNMQPSSNEAFQADTLSPPRMGSPFPPGVLDGMAGCAETLIASTMTNMLGIMGGDPRATQATLVQYGGPAMITPPSTAKRVAEEKLDSASIEGFGLFFPIDGNLDALF